MLVKFRFPGLMFLIISTQSLGHFAYAVHRKSVVCTVLVSAPGLVSRLLPLRYVAHTPIPRWVVTTVRMRPGFLH